MLLKACVEHERVAPDEKRGEEKQRPTASEVRVNNVERRKRRRRQPFHTSAEFHIDYHDERGAKMHNAGDQPEFGINNQCGAHRRICAVLERE